MQNTRTLLLGNNAPIRNNLQARLGSSAMVAGESDDYEQIVKSITTIIVTSIELNTQHEQVLQLILNTSTNHLSIIRIVSLQDSLLTRSTNSLEKILRNGQLNGLMDVITIHAPFFYEDLITDRDSFFINDINTTLHIVKYYGDGDMRLPIISRGDLISYIECCLVLLNENHIATTEKKHLYIRGDLIRLEYIIATLFGRGFQYENVSGRPGEERLAVKCSRLVQKYESVRVDNLLFPSVHPLRWIEFLSH
ncbi:predicted protein [Naegleria gruberi]|uniref:Predicted protein n=1 Tax=Naegleria gruberi TaxID=5762 RepID=D2VUC1_NAEGR|nr:uncharacterized protein NAEGRDRAFT_72610 [Naegleria gruberi]EFC39600.1 predicted protein [Naegleria gruberi]|eukprot:XP_002672344.1 predicted protein [Naegleria gruberi strain NEG-M]